MNVIAEQRAEIKMAMYGVFQAVHHLARVRDAATGAAIAAGRGGEEELLALKLTRACAHLAEAAEDVPEEVWRVVLDGQCAGSEEMRSHWDILLAEATSRNAAVAEMLDVYGDGQPQAAMAGAEG